MNPNCSVTYGLSSLILTFIFFWYLSTICSLLMSETFSEMVPEICLLCFCSSKCIQTRFVNHNIMLNIIFEGRYFFQSKSKLRCFIYKLEFFQFLYMRKKNYLSSVGDSSFSQFAISTPQSRLKEEPPVISNIRTQPNYNFEDDKKNYSKQQMRSLDQLYMKEQLSQKRGLQMQKLNDTIHQIAQQSRKKEKHSMKQNTIDQQESVISNQTLPSLASSHYRKDSSKLMDQIKKVQYKIKALRSEKEEVLNQRKQYEYIRPFVELHNQSVMYMQQMMAQNNKHNCCHNCQHNSHQQPPQHGYYYPPPPPYPMQGGQYPYTRQNNSMSDLSFSNSKSIKKKTFQKGQKKYNFSKIRKFRIAVIAVYFHLLLPKYAKRFTLRRFKAHTNYFNNLSFIQLRRQIEKQMRDKVIKWNMINISQIVAKARAEKEIRRVKQTKTAKLIISEDYNGSDNYQFYLGDVELFLFQFLKRMKEAVEYDDDLQKVLRFAASGSLPFSFPVDNFYLLDELYSLSFHPQRLYLQGNRKVAKALLLSCIFVKLITYSLFFPIKQNQEWKIKMLKVNNMKKQNIIEAEMAAVQMHLGGILLHKYSMQLIQEAMQDCQSNILQINPQSWPVPQSALIFQGSGDVQSAFSAATSKKIKYKSSKVSLTKNPVSMQGYKDYTLYDFNYIKNLNDFQHLLQEINKSSRYEQHVKALIVEIVDCVYQKLMKQRKQDYKRLKDELLLEQKNLLDVKISYSGLALGKRGGQERKVIKQAIQLVKINRQEEEAGSQDQEQEGQEQQQQEKQQSV